MALCSCITGIVIDENTGNPRGGLRVRVVADNGSFGGVPLIEGRTDQDGRFSLPTEMLSDTLKGTGRFEVFDGTTRLSVHGHVRWAADQDLQNRVLCAVWPEICDVPGGTPPIEVSTDGLHGIVRHVNGHALNGLVVTLHELVFDADNIATLGDPETTSGGGWFAFPPPGGSSKHDLFVRVFVPPPEESEDPPHLVATSKVRYGYEDGPYRFEVSVCDEGLRGPSEFNRINADLSNLIPDPETNFSALLLGLSLRRTLWAAGRTGWTAQQVADRALAERLSDTMSQPSAPLGPEVFYGLLRQGFPRSGRELLARPPSSAVAAIGAAKQANIIGLYIQTEDVLDGLTACRAALVAATFFKDSLATILGSSGVLSSPQIESFCALYSGFSGSDSALWTAVAALSEFTDADHVQEARRLIRLGALALGHGPTLVAILGELGTGEAAENVVTWSSSTWTDVAGAVSAEDLPQGLVGEDTAARRVSLATLLQEQASLAFPAAAQHATLSGATGTALGVSGVFGREGNGALDLRTARLHDGTAEVTLSGDAEEAATELSNLRLAQRLVRIAPTLGMGAALERLQEMGIGSAKQVVQLGKTRFMQRYAGSDPLMQEEARQIISRSRSQTAMAASFLLSAHPALGQTKLSFVPTESTTVSDSDIPGWSSLFTTSGGGRCAWCQSIHGPSAYLVDLLHWLDLRTDPTLPVDAPGPSALDMLLARRPDIENLPLTCENVERVLPYIDLTLEILEAAVTGAGQAIAQSSEVESEEQLAAPQYVQEEAYETGKLGDAHHSFQTPFHRPLVEARSFLKHLGVDRADLMRAFLGENNESRDVIAVEELKLSVEAAAAILDTSTEAAYWAHDIGAEATVRDLRRSAELSYVEILDLLHTRLVNPDLGVGQLVVGRGVSDDPYDVSSFKLKKVTAVSGEVPTAWADPDAADYTRIRKVLRLWKATGWSLLTLDRVMFILPPPPDPPYPDDWKDPASWSQETLTRLGAFVRLTRITGLDPVELASWFGNMDVREDRETAEPPSLSLYDRTWLSTSLFPKAEQEEVALVEEEEVLIFPFVLNSARTELDSKGFTDEDTLSQHHTRIAAVLGLSTTEVDGLIAALVEAWGEDNFDLLTLENLGHLYRWTSLARVLHLRPTEVLRMATLLGVAPAPTNHGALQNPEVSLDFLKKIQDLQATGWTVDGLDWLLRHQAADRVAPTDETLRGLLGRLRDSVLATSTAAEADRVDALARILAEHFQVDRSFVVDLHERMWMGAYTENGEDYSSFAVADLELGLVTTTGPVTLTGAIAMELTANVSSSAGTLTSGTVLNLGEGSAIGTVPSGVAEGSTCILSNGEVAFSSFLPTASIAVPSGVEVSYTGGTATLTAPATGNLLRVDPSVITSANLLTRFLSLSGSSSGNDPWADLTRDAHPEHYAVLDAIAKAAHLLRTLGADTSEYTAWKDRVSMLGLLDPAELLGGPLSFRTTDGTDRLIATTKMFALRGRLVGDSPTFAEILEDPTAERIATRTGWDEELVGALLSTTPITGMDSFHQVLDQIQLVLRCGADPAVVAGWAASGDLNDFTADIGRQVVAAVRSRHPDASAWAAVARPLRDRVRKAQRDALVSYLITRSGSTYNDANDLYRDLLIDVQMNPEMLTSRVVQATAAVQLFVHRTLFGLEDDGSSGDLGAWFNEEDREEWEWRKNYRVWEAARKVFLYPENWIEPELRDDKTPFFRTLEQELAQGDVTAERVEEVTLGYLDRLHKISSLKVLACYVEKEADDGDGPIDRFHVFARTRSEPPTYWYRRREDGSTWTAWEEVKIGLSGDHLVPVVHNRRLLLFWAEFFDGQTAEENPNVWWEIRLSMSEYRDGQWSPKQQGTEPLRLDQGWMLTMNFHKDSKESYGFFSGVNESGDLVIRCVAENRYTSLKPKEIPKGYASELGSFVLNPCTMDLEISVASTAATIDHLCIEPHRWMGPGSANGGAQVSDKSLSVYKGSATEDGQAIGTAAPVTLLEQAGDCLVVVPSQQLEFVSQFPFFVTIGERVYCVEVRTSQMEDKLDSEAPSVASLSSFRSRTWAQASESEPLTDEDIEGYAAYVPVAEFPSEAALRDMIRGVATGMSASDTLPTISDLSAYNFSLFYHPYTCTFIREVRRDGVMRLLSPDPAGPAGALFRQALSGDPDDFATRFLPTSAVVTPRPLEEIDFSQEGAYSQYNWEIFFHLPLYLSGRLVAAGRYDEAIRWLHTVFDPRTRASSTGVENGDWWRIKPLLEPASAPITSWAAFVGAEESDARRSFENQVAAWAKDPFNPHLLARLRPGTYARNVVMRYVDTLIAWADHLFTQDSRESINEATLLYTYALQVLGDRPEWVGDIEKPAPKSYSDLRESLDDFSNALVTVENASFVSAGSGTVSTDTAILTGLVTGYFCVPFNTKLLSLWDVVEDRLFKIRNGLNIDGVARSLPLFSPPIDPAMLVRAAAAGIDIGSALSADADVGHYRYSVMVARAQALAGSVRSLGQALLSALEKRDAEELALLRQGHESALLEAVEGVRERQVEEAKEGLAGLRRSRKVTEERQNYYQRLIDKGWIGEEKGAAALTGTADVLGHISSVLSGIAGVVSFVPDVSAGTCSSLTTGGAMAARSMQAISAASGGYSALARSAAAYLTTTAGYKRREQEWKNQVKLAEKELAAMDKQIAGAEIRVEVARRELSNHRLQMRHSTEVRDWMERKFTGKDLYNWMVSELCTLHYQSWQLAYTVAKKAEACFKYEQKVEPTTSYIRAGAWDSQRKGLLAGERLQQDLERMDVAWLEQDRREFELVKHVALSLLDPVALAQLRANGECYFEIPEVLFDLDCPGHYYRRIQNVALSIACVAGPQGTVNAQLTLHGSWIRDLAASSSKGWVAETSSMPTIVTSVATQDTGLFAMNAADPRYLPFERRGAVSHWHLKLTAQVIKQIDWSSIEDVVLHMRYTARDGGTNTSVGLSGLAVGFGSSFTSPLESGYVRLISLKRDFAEEFFAAQQANETSIEITVPEALRAPSSSSALAGVLALPVGGSGPTTTHLTSAGTAASSTFATDVVYFRWTSSLPDLAAPIALCHGTESSREEPVLARLAEPPTSPTEGDRYLVITTATDAWELQEGNIAEYDGTDWGFSPPSSGMAVYVEDEEQVYLYSSSWTPADWTYTDLTDLLLILLYR